MRKRNVPRTQPLGNFDRNSLLTYNIWARTFTNIGTISILWSDVLRPPYKHLTTANAITKYFDLGILWKYTTNQNQNKKKKKKKKTTTNKQTNLLNLFMRNNGKCNMRHTLNQMETTNSYFFR